MVVLPSALSSLQRAAEHSASRASVFAEAEAAQRKVEPGFVLVQELVDAHWHEALAAVCSELVAVVGSPTEMLALPAEATAAVGARQAEADGLSESEAASDSEPARVQPLAAQVLAEQAQARVQPVLIALRLPLRR